MVTKKRCIFTSTKERKTKTFAAYTLNPHNNNTFFLSQNSNIMARNIKTVIIEIPNSTILKRLNSTPTFSRLSKAVLKVGANRENVNHKTYSDMLRLYPLLGVTVTEVII